MRHGGRRGASPAGGHGLLTAKLLQLRCMPEHVCDQQAVSAHWLHSWDPGEPEGPRPPAHPHEACSSLEAALWGTSGRQAQSCRASGPRATPQSARWLAAPTALDVAHDVDAQGTVGGGDAVCRAVSL